MYDVNYHQRFKKRNKNSNSSTTLIGRFDFREETDPSDRQEVIQRIASICSTDNNYLAPIYLKSGDLEIRTRRNFLGKNLKLLISAKSPRRRDIHDMVDLHSINFYVLTGGKPIPHE